MAIMKGFLNGECGGITKTPPLSEEKDLQILPYTGPQLVSGRNNRFLSALSLLVEELQNRIQRFPETEYHRPVLKLLSADANTLAFRFGSFTAAWDQLVSSR